MKMSLMFDCFSSIITKRLIVNLYQLIARFSVILVSIQSVTISSNAQDVRDAEIKVIDRSCIEQKIAQCVFDNFYIEKKSAQNFPCPSSMKLVKIPYHNLCKFIDIASMIRNVQTEYQRNIFQPYNPVDKLDRTLFESTLTNCKRLAENFPNLYQVGGTNQKCLKPLSQERLLSAIGVEIKRLRSKECTDETCSQLDKVPPQ